MRRILPTIPAIFLLWIAGPLAGCGADTDGTDEPVVINSDTGGQADAGPIGGDDTGNTMAKMDSSSTTDTGSMSDSSGGTDTNGSKDTGSRDTGSKQDTSMMANVPEVDPKCVDGKYSEPLPNAGANISSEMSNYSSSQLQSFVLSVLKKRYSVGEWLVDQAVKNYSRTNCIERFSRNTGSATGVIGDLSTIVHECGHLFDLSMRSRSGNSYAVTRNLTITCSGGATKASGGQTFPRSELYNDSYQSKHPPCGGGAGRNCDSYADIYLDPSRRGSDQGFNMVLEEAYQYVNSLATSYAFKDKMSRSTSAMDGILTFLWYVERYLYLARTKHPQAYKKLTQDACWRKAILTMWGRAWLMLDAAKNYNKLGISEQKLFGLVRDKTLLKEIERLRTAHGCP